MRPPTVRRGLAFAGVLLATQAPAATWHVPAQFATIGAALGHPAAADGDSILVAPGTYSGAGNRDLSFAGKDLVLVATGGAAVTIIDAGGTPDDNHRGFLFAGGPHGFESNAAVLDGFTIINGHMATAGGPELSKTEKHDLSGAGIMIRFMVSPTIRNCVIRNCYSEFTGGGVGVEFGATPRLENVVIQGCGAGVQGGGLTVETVGAPTLVGCVITGCRSRLGGGAALGDLTTLIDCVIAGNTADRGGGLDVIWPANVVVRNSVIWNNCAPDSGAQVFVDPALTLSGGMSFECAVVDTNGILDRSGVTKFIGTGNVFRDPLFCAPVSCDLAPTAAGDYTVQAASPCLPHNNACAVRIGILGQGCETRVEARTWTDVKSRYRSR